MKISKTYENFLSDLQVLRGELDKAKSKFQDSSKQIWKKEEVFLIESFERLSFYENNFFKGGYLSNKGKSCDSYLQYLNWLIDNHIISQQFINSELSSNKFSFGTNNEHKEFILDCLAVVSQMNDNESVGVALNFYANNIWSGSRFSNSIENINSPIVTTNVENPKKFVHHFHKEIKDIFSLDENKFVEDLSRKIESFPVDSQTSERFYLIAEFQLFFLQ